MKTSGYAGTDANTPPHPFSFERRDLRPQDVAIDIRYCGVCHTDQHFARNDYPHRSETPQYRLAGHADQISADNDAAATVDEHEVAVSQARPSYSAQMTPNPRK